MKLDQESYFNPNYLRLYYGQLHPPIPFFFFIFLFLVENWGNFYFFSFFPGKLFPFADIFKWVSYGHGNVYQTMILMTVLS